MKIIPYFIIISLLFGCSTQLAIKNGEDSEYKIKEATVLRWVTDKTKKFSDSSPIDTITLRYDTPEI